MLLNRLAVKLANFLGLREQREYTAALKMEILLIHIYLLEKNTHKIGL